MENIPKIAFLKQAYDNVGPKYPYGYTEEITPLDLLKNFNGKTSLFETLLYYKADFIIIPTSVIAPWLNTMLGLPNYKSFIEANTKNIYEVLSIDFSAYDIVITHDPILHPFTTELQKRFPKTLFCFNLVEHSSWQMHNYGFEYDIFLDHTLNSSWDVCRVPQALNYVFPRTPDKIQSMFNEIKNSIFIDYRSYGHFLSQGKNDVAITKKEIANLNTNFNTDLPIEEISEVSLRPYMLTFDSSDSIEFYKKLSRAKYFVTIANRVGQAAFDAASAGCLVIGNKASALHSLLCHPDCLMEGNFSYKDVIKLVTKVDKDSNYFNLLLDYQNSKLQEYAVKRPINDLSKALELKRSNNA